MELRQLEYFTAVNKFKNYTKAAEYLHVSQPTVSIAVQKLEEELGVQLLERDNKNIALTAPGRVFLQEAEKILTAAERLLKIMDDLRPSAKKHLKVAFPSTIGSWLWKELLYRFPAAHPDIEPEIEEHGTAEIIRLLKAQEIEIGYGVIGLADDEEIEHEVIRRGRMKLIVPAAHPFASLAAVPIEKLAGQQLIMYAKGTTYTEKLLLSKLAEKKIAPKLLYVREQSSVFDMVAQECGLAAVLDDRVSAIRDNPRLVSLPFADPIVFDTGLIWSKNKFLSAAARKFKDFIISCKEQDRK